MPTRFFDSAEQTVAQMLEALARTRPVRGPSLVYGAPMDGALLEVAVHHARDVAGAVAGGADRLALVVPDPDDPGGPGTSPEPGLVSAVVRAAGGVPVRAVLRHDAGTGLSGGALVRLTRLAGEYLDLGAEGVVLGFLDADLEVDVGSCRALVRAQIGRAHV